MSIDRPLRRKRSLPVVFDAKHADDMVHASTRRARVSSRVAAAVQTDGRRMIDVKSQQDGSRSLSGARSMVWRKESPNVGSTSGAKKDGRCISSKVISSTAACAPDKR